MRKNVGPRLQFFNDSQALRNIAPQLFNRFRNSYQQPRKPWKINDKVNLCGPFNQIKIFKRIIAVMQQCILFCNQICLDRMPGIHCNFFLLFGMSFHQHFLNIPVEERIVQTQK